MRLIQATVSSGRLSRVKDVLEEHELEYFVTEETSREEYAAIVYVSVPDEKVGRAVEYLQGAGLDVRDHVVILDIEADVFREARKDSDLDEQTRISTAELEAQTEELLPDLWTFLTMMILSTIVATTGLLLDSSAVVVGSMVLAPLFGPAVSASVGTVVDDPDLFSRGVIFQLVGVLVGIGSATVFAWVMKIAYLVPAELAITNVSQIVERLSPDLLSLIVAFAAGIAGVLSVTTGAGLALVGVMMAAALLPPAAIVGIGIAWGEPLVALHSGILLGVNVLTINFAGLTTLWYLGYRPESWVMIPQTRHTLVKRGATLLLAILIASGFLLNATYATTERVEAETAIEEDIEERLDDPAYEGVILVDVKVVQDETSLTYEAEKVIITIGRPPGEQPEARQEIVASVHEQMGPETPVDIRVHIVAEGVPTR